MFLKIDQTNNQWTLQNSLEANKKQWIIATQKDWKNKRQNFPKGKCPSVVHTGFNKMISNAAVIQNYKCNLNNA